MKFTDAVNAALAKAEFKNRDVKDALDVVIESHKVDLGDVGYEPSTDTEDAIKALEEILNEVDEAESTRRADLKEAIKESKESDDTEQS